MKGSYERDPGVWSHTFGVVYKNGKYEQALRDMRVYGNGFVRIEEKKMSKIDWHKPIRAMDGTAAKPYNSHGTRVVWIGDYVYPVDENGRATASVYYPKAEGRTCSVGERLVENVPEEKYLVLLKSTGGWSVFERDYSTHGDAEDNWHYTISRGEAVVVKVPV